MDFFSHILIGGIIGNIFSITSTNLILLLVGCLLPDLSVFPLYIYYGGKRAKENFIKNKKKLPKKWILNLFDFSHSILLMAIVVLLSLIYNKLWFLVLGLGIHILTDIPLHKKYQAAIFFPLKYRIKGFVDWFTLYWSFKSRMAVWSVLIMLVVVSYLI